MNTLHLTTDERAMYEALPEALREGWTVEDETLTYDDSPQKCAIRLSLVRLHDPTLLKLRAQAQENASPEAVAALLQQTNLSDVLEDDLAELFFALGPAILTRLIAAMLPAVSTDADMEGATAITVIRHSVLQSFHPAS